MAAAACQADTPRENQKTGRGRIRCLVEISRPVPRALRREWDDSWAERSASPTCSEAPIAKQARRYVHQAAHSPPGPVFLVPARVSAWPCCRSHVSISCQPLERVCEHGSRVGPIEHPAASASCSRAARSASLSRRVLLSIPSSSRCSNRAPPTSANVSRYVNCIAINATLTIRACTPSSRGTPAASSVTALSRSVVPPSALINANSVGGQIA